MGCGVSKPPPAAADAPPAAPPQHVEAPPPPAAEAPAPAPPPQEPAAGGGGQAERTLVYVLGHDVANTSSLCLTLKEELGCIVLQANELLRREVKAGGELGMQLADMIKQGKIIPPAKTAQLILNAMEAGEGVFLVDGFPKSAESLHSFTEQVQGARQLAIYLELKDAELLSRISASDSSLGEDGAQRRVNAFKRQMEGLLAALSRQGILHTIDAAGGSAVTRAKELLGASSAASAEPAADAAAAEPAVNGCKCIFVLGGPGSGKGTQCQKLVEKFQCLHLSAGDLLRHEVQTGSEQGKAIATMIKEGKIVPAKTTIDLLQAAMASAPPGTLVLIDGFPRSLDNLEAFEAQVGMCEMTVFFALSADVMEARLLERGDRLTMFHHVSSTAHLYPSSGGVSALSRILITSREPGKTSGRTDDNIESIHKRFETFTTQSLPVLAALKEKTRVLEVDASASVDEIAAQVAEEVQKLL